MRQSFMIYDCTAPTDEPFASVGTDNYEVRAKEEGRKTIELLERTKPPEGVTFKIASNPHDFGTYYTIDAVYNDDDEEQTAYVMWLECDAPTKWDETPEVWKYEPAG